MNNERRDSIYASYNIRLRSTLPNPLFELFPKEIVDMIMEYQKFKFFFVSGEYVRCRRIEKDRPDFKRLKFQVREGQATDNKDCEIQIESELGHACQIPIHCVTFDPDILFSWYHKKSYGEKELTSNMSIFTHFISQNEKSFT